MYLGIIIKYQVQLCNYRYVINIYTHKINETKFSELKSIV